MAGRRRGNDSFYRPGDDVLPWTVGLKLGASWEQLDTPIKLTGSLGAAEARALIVEGIITGLPLSASSSHGPN